MEEYAGFNCILLKVLSVPFAAMLVLAGCGEDNDEVKNPSVEENENQAETIPETGTDNNEKLPFTFKDFQLEVDYAGKDNEYDAMGAQTEASIDDQLNKHEVHGDEAMEELTPILEKLTFTKDSSDDEVIQDVMKAFNLKDDYEEFYLEVTYDDGTKKEYKVNNK
ncbi:YusW family protein [Peribacillus sp. NPDC096540]|uniref:YusW family protein n=1 Tax=Peribacillus sp. NPDC096540 TaxID=3390612 RepID=UPI003D0245DA